MTARRARQTWWRRERIAVALLPVVIVGALAASSSRVEQYWWQKGFHEQASLSGSGVARISQTFDDGFLRYPIRADVSLVSAQPVTRLPGAFRAPRVPTGARLWEVRLRWRADPDVALTGCSIALTRDGKVYVARSFDFDPGAVTSTQTCVPEATPGPKPQPGRTSLVQPEAGTPSRPSTYETRAYVVVPTDVVPSAVRVWWLLPTYAELPLPRSRDDG